MIRKEIQQDGTFGGNYSFEIDYPVLPEKFIEITEEQRDFIDANFEKLRYDEAQEGVFESPKGVVDISQTVEYLAQQLAKAKSQKLVENKQKRDERLVAGVEYEGVIFDSDTDSKLNISVQLSEMTDTDTVVWKGMNNERVLFAKQDFSNLVSLLKKLTADIWGDGGLDDKYTKAISDAQVLEELEMIEIDYNQV